MKIDFAIGSMNGGGAERVVSLLANYFANKGHDVRIITFYGGDDYDYHPRIERIRFHKKKVIGNASLRGFFSLMKFYALKKNRPDFLSTHIGMVGYATIIPSKFYKIKSTVSEHFNHKYQPKTFLKWFLWRILYRFPDAITVLTKYDLEFFKGKSKKVVIMENPCSFEIKESYLKIERKKILAIGNLDRYIHKGFDNLLHIVKEVFKVHPDWTLQIVGGGESGKKILFNKSKELGIEKHIIFSGFSKDIKGIMADADIYVLTSRYEGLPMVLIEAMSQKMACISYDCISGPAEIIQNGENGILVSDQNKAEMIEKLEKLISEKSLRLSLASSATKNLDKFLIENVGKKWELLFKEL